MRYKTLTLMALVLLTQAATAKEKILVIGIDGATWDTVDPWITEGALPNIAKLKEGGAHGTLTSILPVVSPVAWPTFATGVNPGRHGIYGFQQCEKDGTEPYIPLANKIKSPRFWQILSENNKTVVIMNVQMTYPPDKVNGVLVSSVLAPDIATHPEDMREWFTDQGYVVEGKGWMDTPKDEFLKDLHITTAKRAEVAEKLMDKYDWDVFVVVFVGSDRIQHYMWADMEDKHKIHGNAIKEYYKTLDSHIGKLTKKAGENTTIIIMSDHGFGRLVKRVHIDYWLKDEGFLVLEKGWSNRKKMLTIKLSGFLKRTGLSELIRKLMVKSGREPSKIRPPKLDIDYEKTRAFTCGYYTGQLYINPEYRGDRYLQTQKELIQKLKELSDPKTGQKIIKEVYRKEDIFHGPATEYAPDIIFLPQDGYWLTGGFNYPSLFEKTIRETGRHELEGIIIIRGPNTRKGIKLEDAKLYDLAPTILNHYNIPQNMDGKPLKQAFK